jgi:hypothetical protein
MSNWERIRQARGDMTDYVIHLTRLVVDHDNGKRDVRDGFRRLQDILKAGYLRPTYARRFTMQKNWNRTVKGPHKAVCLTEQPLEQIPVTLRHGSAYEGYGIALNKADLHDYGGRHAIYGDDETLEDLSENQKYRWVRYCPMRAGKSGYPIDFSFEREWRCRIQEGKYFPWEHELEGIPLLLPEDFRRVAFLSSSEEWIFKKVPPDFRIIVRRDREVSELREFLRSLGPDDGAGPYYRIYRLAVRKAQIISLEHVKRRLALDHDRYRRIEDLYTPAERPDVIRMLKKASAKS